MAGLNTDFYVYTLNREVFPSPLLAGTVADSSQTGKLQDPNLHWIVQRYTGGDITNTCRCQLPL